MNNPYGSYTRHNTTTAERMAALWKEVAREHAARSSSARQYARDCHDSMDAAIRRANKAERALASAEFDAATYLADLDAAEEERDEALDALRDLGAAHRALQGLAAEIGRAEQPRALPRRRPDMPQTSDPDCANCNGRGCMDCALRYWHDTCEHTCPMCEPRKARR